MLKEKSFCDVFGQSGCSGLKMVLKLGNELDADMCAQLLSRTDLSGTLRS